MLTRYTARDLGVGELVDLFAAHVAAYPQSRFPPVIEKKALDLALAADPGRDDLRRRLAQVEALLMADWPLL